jgi:hypothetical protein
MANETDAYQGISNVSDGQFEDDDVNAGESTYNPDEGRWGPHPYGEEYTPPEYQNGDPQGLKSQEQYQQQQQEPQYDQEGNQIEAPQSPLEQVAQFMQDNELQFVQSLPPQEQGYFINALSRIDNVYKAKEEELQNYHGQMTEIAEQIAPLVEIDEALLPKVREAGYENTSDYYAELVESDMRMTEDPVGAMLDLMEYYQIPLKEMYNRAVERVDQYNDPYYMQAKAEREKSEAYARQVEEMREEQEQLSQQEEMDYLEEQINAFASEADETGQYTHPYYPLVQDRMAQLLTATGNFDLEELYDQACWADPDVRADMIANGYGYDDQGYVQQPQQYYNTNAATQYGTPQQQYPQYTNNPSPYEKVARFATSNSPGDTKVRSGHERFEDIFARNYERFSGRPY